MGPAERGTRSKDERRRPPVGLGEPVLHEEAEIYKTPNL
jgi:hypothetical protein